MKKYQILVLIIYLAGQGCYAQSDKVLGSSKLHLGFGYNKTFFKDITYSPLNYQGNSFQIELGYERIVGNNNIFFTNFDFSFSVIKSKASVYFNSPRYLGNIGIGYLKNIPFANKKLSFLLGGKCNTYGSVAYYDGGASITYFGLHSLDLQLRLNYLITHKHSLSTSFSLPIFGLLVRPVFTGWDKLVGESGISDNSFLKIATTGKWATIKDFSGVNYQLNYGCSLNSKWDLGVGTNIRYYSTNYLKSAKYIDAYFVGTMQFKF